MPENFIKIRLTVLGVHREYAYTRRFIYIYIDYFVLIPGVKKLIDHLYKHNIPIGLATSSSIESYKLKVQNHLELFDLITYKTWGSSDPEVKRGKPHPDIFIVAANKFPDKPSLDKVGVTR